MNATTPEKTAAQRARNGQSPQKYARFLEWRFDEKNQAVVDHWEAEWFAPDAMRNRSRLGFHDTVSVLPENTITASDRLADIAAGERRPINPFQAFDQNLLWAGQNYRQSLDPRRMLSINELQERCRAHLMSAFDEIWHWQARCPREHPAAFFEGLAKYLRKHNPSPMQEEGSCRLKLLKAFRRLVQQLGELPNRGQLEEAAYRTKTSSIESNRRTLNRRLKEVGLGGLPEREHAPRRPGDVRVPRRSSRTKS